MAALVACARASTRAASRWSARSRPRCPAFALPALDSAQVRELATGALAIALLGLLEAISMAKAIAAQTARSST